MKLITDQEKLQEGVEQSDLTQERISEISVILNEELEKHGGLGLSTNQIGLSERAFIVNVIDPIVVVNPTVIAASPKKIVYTEQCLSIPKTMEKPKKVIRHTYFKIQCDNLGVVEFNADNPHEWETPEEYFSDKGLLESVVAQHQVDLLNGILITDPNRRYSSTFIKKNDYGRNERVMVRKSDGETEFMKYKYAKKLLNEGAEIL